MTTFPSLSPALRSLGFAPHPTEAIRSWSKLVTGLEPVRLEVAVTRAETPDADGTPVFHVLVLVRGMGSGAPRAAKFVRVRADVVDDSARFARALSAAIVDRDSFGPVATEVVGGEARLTFKGVPVVSLG